MAVAVEVADDQGALRLAEALHDGKAGGILELAENLGVQGFAGGGSMLDAAQVEAAQVLLGQHPVHGGRCAEGRDLILGEQRQDLLCIEAVEVIYEDGCLAEPLTVNLTPGGLCPTGVGNGQMEAVGIYPVPVFGGNEVTQGVLEVVGCQLGVAGGAGSEEHQHGIAAAGRILSAEIVAGVQGVFLVEVVPAFLAAVHQNLVLQTGAVKSCGIHRVGNITISGTEDGLDVAGLEAVGEVLFQKLIGGGDGHGAQLVQSQHGEPVLVVALQDQHHTVAPLDTHGLEVVGGSCGFSLQILEGEPTLGAVIGQIEHGQLLRLGGAQFVHDVECKVELLFTLEGDLLQKAVFHGPFNELAVDAVLLVGSTALGVGSFQDGCLLVLTGGRVAQHDGVECTILAVHSGHAVGNGGIVVNGITGPEDFRLAANLDLHLTPDDDVALLTFVGHQFDVFVFCTGAVFDLHVQRQRDAVAEVSSQVVANHMVSFLDTLTFTLSGQSVGTELCAAAFQQVGHIHAEDQHTAVQERDAQITAACLTGDVFFCRNTGMPGHFLNRQTADFTQFPDTAGHFLDFIIHTSHCIFHKLHLK